MTTGERNRVPEAAVEAAVNAMAQDEPYVPDAQLEAFCLTVIEAALPFLEADFSDRMKAQEEALRFINDSLILQPDGTFKGYGPLAQTLRVIKAHAAGALAAGEEWGVGDNPSQEEEA